MQFLGPDDPRRAYAEKADGLDEVKDAAKRHRAIVIERALAYKEGSKKRDELEAQITALADFHDTIGWIQSEMRWRSKAQL